MSTATTVPTTVFQPRYQFIQVWSGWSGRSCQSTSQSSHILCDGGKGRLSAEAPVSKHQLSKFSKVSWSSKPLASTGIHCFQNWRWRCDWKQAAFDGSRKSSPGSWQEAAHLPQKWIKLQLCCDWLIFALSRPQRNLDKSCLPQLPQKIPAFEGGWGLKVETVVWSLASCGCPLWKISRGEQKTSLNIFEVIQICNHRIGWWENLLETPIFDGKNHGFL